MFVEQERINKKKINNADCSGNIELTKTKYINTVIDRKIK